MWEEYTEVDICVVKYKPADKFVHVLKTYGIVLRNHHVNKNKVVPRKEYKKISSKVTVQEICSVKSRNSAEWLRIVTNENDINNEVSNLDSSSCVVWRLRQDGWGNGMKQIGKTRKCG